MRLGYKARLVGWHAAAVTVILLVATTGLDWTMRRLVLDQFDAALLQAAQIEATEIAEEGDPSHVHAQRATPVHRLLLSFHPVVQVIDLEGRVVALGPGLSSERWLPAPPSLLSRLQRGKITFRTVSDPDTKALRMVAVPVTGGNRRYAVQVAQPLREVEALLARLRLLLVGSSVTILAAMLLTDVLLTRRALRPIDAIVQQARRIRDANLAERLPHPDMPGELGRLVDTLNEMLRRLHDSFQAQRRFTADAAHELRSPLTRLRTEIEVALRRPRALEQYRVVLEASLEEIQRLVRLTENLLALARLDAGEGHEPPTGPTPLTPIIEEVVERLVPVAALRRVEVDLLPTSAVAVLVLPAIVDVVVANVLDNAIKFSPPAGRVAVRVSATDAHALVAVADAGPGIPAEELPRVFERFFRGRAPRAGDAPGVGLGLAIARTLVERQGGGISLESRPGSGTTVTIRLPLAPGGRPALYLKAASIGGVRRPSVET